MQYVYSALLLNSAEKEVSEENITAVLKAAGIEADAGRVKALVAALDGADFDAAMEAATAAPVAVAGGAPAAAEEAPAEEEEEDEGVSEDEAAAGLGALFG